MASPTARRARVLGKFFEVDGARLYLRGVPYGPSPWSEEWPARDDVETDFHNLVSKGFNAVRTSVVPPSWFLEAAAVHGLVVIVGLPVERWIGRLIDGADAAMLEKVVRGAVGRCQPYSAVLCYVLGDGIPTSTIRWLGHRRLEHFLYRFYLAAKGADPDGAVACTFDPSAQALSLAFLDLLDLLFVKAGAETRAGFDRMLREAQAVAADRPLIVGDLGIGGPATEHGRSQFLDWQVRRLLAEGCAGAVLGWRTHPGRQLGGEPEMRDGQQRASTQVGLAAAPGVALFRNAPFPSTRQWPRASVVVCSHNGGSSIRECLEGIERLEYPNYETIVVDDGSTDDTATIARMHRVSVISTPRRGLASARNTGLDAASGSIVAFIDHRVRPDPAWLTYLGAGLASKHRAAVGGSTLISPGVMNECIANAPGNPALVLLGGGEDELLQASNMAFRRATLREMGGFDPRFQAGGDEVEIGLRLRDRGYSLATSPGAIVWWRERHSVRGYLRSQVEYGRAEGLLEAIRPHSYNRLGQALSSGRGSGQTSPPRLGRRSQLHFGVSGIDWFQLPAGNRLRLLVALPLTPEWYLLVAGLIALTMLSIAWPPLLLAGPFLAVVIGLSILRAIGAARGAFFRAGRRGRLTRLLMQIMIMTLHLLQPAARLYGRYRSGLSPWRRRRIARLTFPRPSRVRFPTEARRPHDAWLRSLREVLDEGGSLVVDAGPDDGFDFEVHGGTFGSARMLLAVDDRSRTEQIVMVRSWPRWSSWLLLFAAPPAVLSISAAASSVGSVAALMGLLVFDLLLRAIEQAGAAQTGIKVAVTQVVGAVADPVSARGRRQLELELAVHHEGGTAAPEQTARRRVTPSRRSGHAAPP